LYVAANAGVDYLSLYGNAQGLIHCVGREELQSKEVASDKFGEVAVNPKGKGVVVCGSLGEVANDPSLRSGFDINQFGSQHDSRTDGLDFSSDTTGLDFFNGQW
jgi:hypothetical protein